MDNFGKQDVSRNQALFDLFNMRKSKVLGMGCRNGGVMALEVQ